MSADKMGDRLHSVGIQMRLLGERGGSLPAEVLAEIGKLMMATANQMRRMERMLDDIVADAQDGERRSLQQRRRQAVIDEIKARLPGLHTANKSGEPSHD